MAIKYNINLTLTTRVRNENMPGASTPFKYAFTSGIPDPAASGAKNTVIPAANIVSTKFDAVNTQKAHSYLICTNHTKIRLYLINSGTI